MNLMLPDRTAADLPGVTGLKPLPCKRLVKVFSWILERELEEVVLPLKKALLEEIML